MKKSLIIGIMLLACGTLVAQKKINSNGIANRLGVQLSAGTEGLSLGVATPVTQYLEASFGINFMPGISVNEDVDVRDVTASGITIPINKVTIKGESSRTTCDFKISCYPFGKKNALFVVTGFSFGGANIISLTGYSEAVKIALTSHPQLKDKIVAEIDKYNVKFNDQGEVTGSLRVKSFRPYLGLGYGRLAPKNRVGFRFELGCQFHGKMKVYQNNQLVDISNINKAADDFSDIIDKITVYPVMKFMLTGRIL